MTTAEIEMIEREFGIRLPADYRDLVLAYPFPEDSALADYAMPDRPADILEMNRSMREHPWSPEWKQQYFLIGHDGGECWYFVDTSRPQSRVFSISMEDNGIVECAADLAGFVADNHRVDAEFAADEARRSKVWWRRIWRLISG